MAMKKAICYLVTSIMLLFPSASQAVSGETLEIWGSTTCQKRFLEPGARDVEKATGITIKVNGSGTGQGLLALIEGKTEISAASEDLKDSIKLARNLAQQDSIPLSVPKNLVFHKIMDDEIVPIVHKSNSVKALSWKQLKDIHTGNIRNWQEVGGPDLPITIVTSHEGSATRSFFSRKVLDNAPFSSNTIKVDSTAKEILEVSIKRGAIGVVSIAFLMITPMDTRILKTEKIVRPLGLITIGTPSGKAKKAIEYLQSEEGQKSINKMSMP